MLGHHCIVASEPDTLSCASILLQSKPSILTGPTAHCPSQRRREADSGTEGAKWELVSDPSRVERALPHPAPIAYFQISAGTSMQKTSV